jgi:aminomethyltransferase
MKKTAFNELHKKYGGKLVEFAGFEMPIQYEGIVAEHKAVRESVGVFDVSHMGEVEVHGKDALAFVQKITTNDASILTKGKIQYSAMCYKEGGVVDDLLVHNCGD